MKAKGKDYVLSNVRDFTDVHASSLQIKPFTREEVMIGKEKCRILKEIRQKIADENDIAYVTRECTHQGDCRGTCPKCESELRYLEKQLAARAAAGKRIAIAALCAGMTFSLSSCANLPDNKGKETVEELGGAAEPMPEPDEDVVLDGEVGPDYYDEDELEGKEVKVAEVIPAASAPLRHCICFALCSSTTFRALAVYPGVNCSKRRLSGSCWLVSFYFR